MKKVKSTLPSFAESISEGNIDSLEDLICRHYDEFLCLFQVLKDSVSDITRLEYKEKEDGKMTIHVHTDTFNSAERIVKKAKRSLSDIGNENCESDISLMVNIVKIKIIKK